MLEDNGKKGCCKTWMLCIAVGAGCLRRHTFLASARKVCKRSSLKEENPFEWVFSLKNLSFLNDQDNNLWAVSGTARATTEAPGFRAVGEPPLAAVGGVAPKARHPSPPLNAGPRSPRRARFLLAPDAEPRPPSGGPGVRIEAVFAAAKTAGTRAARGASFQLGPLAGRGEGSPRYLLKR